MEVKRGYEHRFHYSLDFFRTARLIPSLVIILVYQSDDEFFVHTRLFEFFDEQIILLRLTERVYTMHIKQRYWLIAALLFVLLSIGIGVWVWSGILSLQHSRQHSAQQVSPVHPVPTVAVGLDVTSGGRLLIPAIGVNASIETVGKTSEGLMDVPTHDQWVTVGWYKNGPRPGQIGSAVIDGHLDRTGGAPAVFWNLRKLHPGDIVSVQNKTKHTLHFKVMKVATYAPDVAPVVQIFGQKNGTFLNLVTCAGVWVPAENQTSQRLVVYTKLVA